MKPRLSCRQSRPTRLRSVLSSARVEAGGGVRRQHMRGEPVIDMIDRQAQPRIVRGLPDQFVEQRIGVAVLRIGRGSRGVACVDRPLVVELVAIAACVGGQSGLRAGPPCENDAFGELLVRAVVAGMHHLGRKASILA